MPRSLRVAVVLFLSLVGTPLVAAQAVESRSSLTLVGVRTIAAAAAEEASANDWGVVIVVVDAGGHLLSLERMDGVQLGSLEIAHQKARTAALYGRPTKVFADRLADGDAAMNGLPDVIALEGGLPILVEGEVVGAIGVSGVRADQDAEVAQAGIDALTALLNQ